MVKRKDSSSSKVRQGQKADVRTISSSTLFDFTGRQMTAFGGTFLVGSLIERIGLEELLVQHLTVKRQTDLAPSKFVTAMVLLVFIGFERLSHVVHIAGDLMIARILGISKLPVQSTLWRFLNMSLHKHNERQFQKIGNMLSARVWKLANVRPRRIHLNTDTTSSIAYGNQDGAKVGYCPGKRGAKCFRPILTSISETGEIVLAQQRSGDRVGGVELAKHLKRAINATSAECERIWRADSEFYCKEAIMVCEHENVRFILSVRKTAPVQHLITTAQWQVSSISDGVAQFEYTPHGWKKPYRFIIARYLKKPEEQTDLFEDSQYKYRVFVTDLSLKPENVVKEYDGRAGIENLIEEAKNQVSFAKIPGKNFIATSLFLQIVVLAFNFNRYLQIFGREEEQQYHNEEMKTVRLTAVCVSARISDHSRQTRIHFGCEYSRKSWFKKLMERIRAIDLMAADLLPVIQKPLLGVAICA